MVRPVRRRADEHVPVNMIGNARSLLGSGDDVGGLLPVLERPVGPDENLADLADRPRADHLRPAAKPRIGRPLVAHLRADALLPGRLSHQPRFPDRMRERLLAIHVLAHPHGHHRRWSVMVVGRGNDHGVNLRPEFLEQLAIIVIAPGILELLEVLPTAPLVDVANRDDLPQLPRVPRVALPLPSDPNAGDVQHLVRPHTPCPSMPASREYPEPRDRGPVQE